MYIGIDPGKSGGIAAINGFGKPFVELAVPMPATERDTLDVLYKLGFLNGTMIGRAVVEKVGASPQMGVVSAFTFGKGYGRLLMALTAARIPFDEIAPGKWQQLMGCLSGGDKNVTKRRAQQLFPELMITHAIADALLLAEYCQRTSGLRCGEQRRTKR